MPRIARRVAVGYPHHLTQRGNNRAPVFLDNSDYQKYLELLLSYKQRYQVEVWSYCLMKNHLHLLLVPKTEKGLARSIGLTNMTYTQYFNRKYDRSGRIWQNRFFSCIVGNDAYLWAVARYVENNPVKGGLVTEADAYRWSSARAHCHGVSDDLVSEEAWLAEEMNGKYRDFLKYTDAHVEEDIRLATSTGRPFGGGHFPLGECPH